MWTTLSVRDIARELARCGKNTVARLLAADGFSLQGNSRTIEGRRHPDRDVQFRYINERAKEFLAAGDPVISVFTKKKELVGQHGNRGRSWRPKGEPVRVRDHDFPDPQEGIAIPYGVYDVGANAGFVNVGTDHDTPAFAVESIRRWWDMTGREHYRGAGRLLITADAGGSNDHRKRAWKAELAKLGRRDRAGDHLLPLPARHFQVEQNRAPAVLPHLPHLAGPAAGQPPGHHRHHRRDHHRRRAHRHRPPGRRPLPDWRPGQRRADERPRRRVITRHDFQGSWNYTFAPVPRPAAPAPAPAPAGHDLGVLAHPALTGIPDFAARAAGVNLAWEAAREQRLHLRWDRNTAERGRDLILRT